MSMLASSSTDSEPIETAMATSGAHLPASMTNESASQTLQSGIYRIVSEVNDKWVIDLAANDTASIIGYELHEGENQKWEFARLGPGYSIRSLFNSAYITLQIGERDGLNHGASLTVSQYPVSWALEADDFEAGIWRIRWPNSPFVFDLPGGSNTHDIQLSNRYPFQPTRLWRLVKIEPTKPAVLEFITHAPRKLEPQPGVITTADSVVDAEGLKLGGNGELSITTTTTTTTTSVTVVKRLGCP
ncbi:hypothetical protein B0H34DRAFT_130698 [Crassisporium funariophilum]|nr:hypothetical protein B0H34DRAFT_130698 [Crassisporium funariophilum]